jgi:hypothetical protein
MKQKIVGGHRARFKLTEHQHHALLNSAPKISLFTDGEYFTIYIREKVYSKFATNNMCTKVHV